MRIFIICPVRRLLPSEEEAIEEYIKVLEACGHQVHYPPRDTPQDDPTGLNICRANRAGIRGAEEVHIWYNPNSTGSHFDLGMTFALDKPIKLINDVQPTDTKSFKNFLIAITNERNPR